MTLQCHFITVHKCDRQNCRGIFYICILCDELRYEKLMRVECYTCFEAVRMYV